MCRHTTRELWPATAQLSMIFDLKTTLPAGIPTRFIARQHRFTTDAHWKLGAVLADGAERKHIALVRALPQERQVRLTMRGPNPHNFFTLLRDGVEVTLQRFPGLDVRRWLPCPGHDGNPCDYLFEYDRILRAIEHGTEVTAVQCQETFEDVSVGELLYGLHWITNDRVITRIDELADQIRAEFASAQKP